MWMCITKDVFLKEVNVMIHAKIIPWILSATIKSVLNIEGVSYQIREQGQSSWISIFIKYLLLPVRKFIIMRTILKHLYYTCTHIIVRLTTYL